MPRPLSNDDIRNLLDRMSSYRPYKTEKTIFSIGGRGHFENPVSDVLAFFLDPREEHGLGNFVLNALFQVSKTKEAADSVINIEREVSTDNGKRLDLIIEGDEWVVAIENKIYHNAVNPFDDYEKHLKKNYKGYRQYRLLLTPKNDNANGWCTVGYADLIHTIRTNWGHIALNTPMNKWQVFLRDFLINLDNYTGRNSMEAPQYQFLLDNMDHIYKLESAKEEFKGALIDKVKTALYSKLPDVECSVTEAPFRWYNCLTIRIVSSHWLGGTQLRIVTGLGNGEELCLVAVLAKAGEADKNRVKQTLETKFQGEAWCEDGGAAFRFNKRYDNFDCAFEDLGTAAVLITEFESERQNN